MDWKIFETSRYFGSKFLLNPDFIGKDKFWTQNSGRNLFLVIRPNFVLFFQLKTLRRTQVLTCSFNLFILNILKTGPEATYLGLIQAVFLLYKIMIKECECFEMIWCVEYYSVSFPGWKYLWGVNMKIFARIMREGDRTGRGGRQWSSWSVTFVNPAFIVLYLFMYVCCF